MPATPRRLRWPTLEPQTWRRDLLQVVLRITAALGAVVYVPSAYLAAKSGLTGVLVLDTVALVAVCALTYFQRIPVAVRAAGACLTLYAVGAGLLLGVGSISQIYLFGFSLLTMLLLGVRWGVGSVLLNTATMLAIGYVGIAAPEMVVPRWRWSFAGWSVVTANFVLVNAALVLAVGAVIRAMEIALERSVTAREQLERDRGELVKVNQSLEAEVHERTRVEAALLENRALLRIAGRTARLGGWRVDVGGDHFVWSDEACELHGVPAGTSPTLDEAQAFYPPEHREVMAAAVRRCADDGTPFDLEAEIVTATGARLWIRAIGNAVRDAAGTITRVHGSVQDITPQKLADARHEALAEQLRQAQKLETVGSLAGGVAHDFNNLLSVVLSYTELLVADLAADDPMRADLEEIRGAGKRAVDLTRQLLAFSRQQVLAPKIVDLAGIVMGMEKMLRRIIGEDIELTAHGVPGLGRIRVDPGQIEQVIMNLAVNARDAMPRGGMLTIETAEVLLDERYASEHVGVTPGMHIMLAVSDTGTGMDKATQARMFEPFFTTKAKGKGTGLGLATVFGIVRQSGGTIWVYSEPGKGTTFKIYFPIAEGALETPTPAPERQTMHGSETILLVEDEEGVRILARTILRKYGYTVLEARNGEDALSVSEQHAERIDLLLTDVVMPRMGGRELVERLQPMRPAMKVLYMSGYTDDAVVRHGVLDATLAFIQKPITPEPLARKVRAVLDAGAAGPPDA